MGVEWCDVSDCDQAAVVEIRFDGQRSWVPYCARHDVRIEVDGFRLRRRGWPPWLIGAWRDLPDSGL